MEAAATALTGGSSNGRSEGTAGDDQRVVLECVKESGPTRMAVTDPREEVEDIDMASVSDADRSASPTIPIAVDNDDTVAAQVVLPQATAHDGLVDDDMGREPSVEINSGNRLRQQNENGNGRLIIVKVELHNFKSYGGKKVIGPFHQKFSAIVGPNGSGKSNVIDGMLFVFGRRANQLRLKKVSELIHKSSLYPNLSAARVSVYFRRIRDVKGLAPNEGEGPADGKFVVVPGSEFVISREARIDNSSKYFINGKATQQKAVIERLKGEGVDLDHNRFLILQGEVEQIAQMKPKAMSPGEEGLLEYLEDMIGSNKYVEPIKEKEEELDKHSEVALEKRNRLTASKKELEALTGPRLEAERYCRNEKKILRLKSKLEQIQKLAIERQAAKVAEAMEANKAEWQEWRQQRETEMKEKTQAERLLSEEHAKVKKLKAAKDKLEAEFEKYEERDQERALKVEHCNNRIRALQGDVGKLKTDSEKAKEGAKTCADRLRVITDKLPQVERLKDDAAAKLEDLEKRLEGELEKLTKVKDEEEKELEPLKAELDEVELTLKFAANEKNLLEEKQKKAEELIKQTKEKKTQHTEQRKIKTKEIEQLKEAIAKNQKSLRKTCDELEKIKQLAEESKLSVRQTRQKVEENERHLKETRSDANLFTQIVSARDSGELPGVVDSLWNLGRVDEEYEEALSAAAPGDFIVTNETLDAERVIDFVRKKKLGRVTCIVLSKVWQELHKQMAEVQALSVPHNAKLLLRLLKDCQPEHLIAFFFVLRDTLVAKNMEVAREIAFSGSKRWRVATLQGGIVDRSGTMTGGGGASTGDRPIRRRQKAMQCTISPKEIEAMKYQLRDLEASSSRLNEKKASLDAQRAALDQQLDDDNRRLKVLKVEIESLEKTISQCERHLKEIDIPELSAEEKEKLKHLESEISRVQADVRKRKIVYDEGLSRVKAVDRQIADVGGPQRKALRNHAQEAKKEFQSLMKEKEEKKVKVKYNEEKSAKKAQQIPEKEAEVEEEKKTLGVLEREKIEIEESALSVMERKEEVDNLFKERLAEEAKVEKRVKELLEGLKSAGLKEVEFQNKHADFEADHAKLKQQEKSKVRILERFQEEWATLPIIENIDSTDRHLGGSVKTDKNKESSDEDELLDGRENNPNVEGNKSDENRRIDTKLNDTKLRINLSEEIVDGLKENALQCRLRVLEGSQDGQKPNFAAIEKYGAQLTKYKAKESDYISARDARDTCRKDVDTLKNDRETLFMSGFTIIAARLREMYQMITTGGDAELELADGSSPFTGGIAFSVRPPKKSWKHIQNLSGGEKTLSSLALVFALHHFRPTPVYFMDEIDAALDYRNVSIIAHYIEERVDAQFIIISLRHQMFERADRLVGIYKTRDVTKSVAIDPAAIAAKVATHEDDENRADQNNAVET